MSTHHVIIGGGPVAIQALETIRRLDGGASRITLICDEPAHSRMALPYWLAGQIPQAHTLTADDAYYQALGVEARIGVRVQEIDPATRRCRLSDGDTLEFDDLLIATGSSPLALDAPGADLPGVQPLWNLADTGQALATGLDRPRVVLIGAGFVGCIVLNAMYKRGWELTVVERDGHLLPRMLDAEAAALVERWLGERGVTAYTGVTVRAIGEDGEDKRVQLSNGVTVPADLVIVATGVRPNLDCIQGSGIATDQGILVNRRMQTNFPFIYAAGDVAQGPVLFSDAPAIHAIQPTAVDHGRIAGANMAGREIDYPGSLAMNILDLRGLQCASYGNGADLAAEATTMTDRYVYRRLLWTGDEITGAIFTGHANDVGMLTDLGMVKGLMQTRTALGAWKSFLQENPFDIRRPYVATGVGGKLAGATLLDQPSVSPKFHFGGAGVTV